MFVRISSRNIKSTLRRAAVIAIAVVLLHAFAIDWAGQHIQALIMQDQAPPPIAEVQLPPPAPPAPEPPPKIKPFKAKAKPMPQQQVSPAPAALAADPPPDAAAPADLPAPSGDGTAKPAGQEVAAVDKPPEAPVDNPADKPEEDKGAPVHYKVEFPPSAELKYDVEKVPTDGNPTYGSGSISWQKEDGKYQVNGKASVLFFTVMKFSSEGTFDSYGIAPVLYSDKRGLRSETATHFNRDQRNNISFSASQLTYQIKGGEQDYASVVWEIASIGRGDREKFVPGAQIDLFVAGARDADIWSILVVGQEEIEIDHNKMQTWHVVRSPREGSYERKIDIWLAPQDQWYPVKIRQTEKSGDYFDMTMTSVRALPDQAAR